jgi:hypothetical protein
MSRIYAGDYVTIGDSALTWFVKAIHYDQSANGPLAHLVSGQTERNRYEPLSHLTLFKSGDAE